MSLDIGDSAPDFKLASVSDGDITLSQFKGEKYVILSFHVLDFTGGWTDQATSFRKYNAQFEESDAQVLGISCDSTATLAAYNLSFGPSLGYPVQLLSDFYPHGDVTKKYKLFNSEIGTADRSAVVIDKSGYVRQVNKYQFRSVLGPNGYGIVDLDFNVKDLISFIEDL